MLTKVLSWSLVLWWRSAMRLLLCLRYDDCSVLALFCVTHFFPQSSGFLKHFWLLLLIQLPCVLFAIRLEVVQPAVGAGFVSLLCFDHRVNAKTKKQFVLNAHWMFQKCLQQWKCEKVSSLKANQKTPWLYSKGVPENLPSRLILSTHLESAFVSY